MDTPESLAKDMLESIGAAMVASRAAVVTGAKSVKDDARRNVLQSAPTHNAHAAYAITYDLKKATTSAEAEIGYDKDRPGGAIGNLLEYGGGGDHSPPHRDVGRALDVAEPKFVNAMELIGKNLL